MALSALGYWYTPDYKPSYGVSRGPHARTRGPGARARRSEKRDWRRVNGGQSFKAYVRSLATNGVQQ